ncbi:MAG: beta-propeller fold lactonase family protein, partial [Thermoleophilia bacterium]|nr:beta-propeller fold lactonase family protein [Thermoleophilia bacterium]
MVSEGTRRARARRRLGAVLALSLGAAVAAAPAGSAAPKRVPPLPKVATTSSPITLAPDGRTVWVVNPGAGNVAVIRTDTNRVIRRIGTDRQPRAVAIDPRGRYAYVANAEDNSVTVIQIQNPDPRRFRARRVKDLVTGAEPWNVVASPDGKRVFVSNSGQDTVTVINTATNRIIGSVDVGNSLCNDPDRTRHFQPRGLAVNGASRFLYVTSFFAFTVPGGRQGSDTGRAGAVCQVRINTSATRIGGYRAARLVQLAPQVTGFTVDSTGDGVADPTSAFPNQLQSIVIRGNQAYLPNIAASPTGPLRFNVDTEAFVNVIDGVNGGSPADGSAAKFLNLHLGARNPEAGRTRLFFANVWAIAFARRGAAQRAYVVSAGSDLLVKLNVDRSSGKLDFTVDQDTTRYIDLNDPALATGGAACRANDGRFVPAAQGCGGKNPQGIAINAAGTRA